MVFVQFEVMPNENVAHRDFVAGAYANCWVLADDVAQGEQQARTWVADEGWYVVSVEDIRIVDVAEELYSNTAQYVQDALQHGGSVVLYRWPPGGEPTVG